MPEIRTIDGVLLKQIPESPNDDYMAGEDGRIYSRTRYAGFGRKDRVDWYPLKGHTTGKGYLSISMCHQNRKVTKHVHRLVCSAFHGPPPSKSSVTRHMNGDPSDNTPDNLAWGNQTENWKDRRVHGTASVGEKHWNSTMTDAQRRHLQWAIKAGLCSQRHAARVLGISQSTVSAIVHGKWE